MSDPGLYIRGADAIIIPIKNASGVKLRAVESLACGKPVVATPEAVQGLPEDLRAMTYVASTADEFVDHDIALLSNAKGPVRSLVLDGWVPPPIKMNHMRGGRQV